MIQERTYSSQFAVFKKYVFFALLLIALLATAVWQNNRLVIMRRQGIVSAPGAAADTPPALNLIMVGLGGFRGLVAEVLWFKMDKLQQEGRYIEIVQFSDWIARLDPRATEIWVYSAWNMAYNISAMMARPEDRLRWVNLGVSRLRDDALKWNPDDAKLYKELAWIYLHKIGTDSDIAHITYKHDLAEKMSLCVRPDGSINNGGGNDAAFLKLNLDFEKMEELQKLFGILDWRIPETHSLYWSWQGMQKSKGFDELACRRLVCLSLNGLIQHGIFNGSSDSQEWRTSPNGAIILPALNFFEESLRRYQTDGMRNSYGAFLIKAGEVALHDGNILLARQLENRLHELGFADSVDKGRQNTAIESQMN